MSKAGVEGLSRTQRAMQRLAPAMREKIGAAVQRAAEDVQKTAARIAPRDTGELAGAIEVRDSLEGFRATGAVGNFVRAQAARREATAEQGIARFVGVFPGKDKRGYYAVWVEYGTNDTKPKPFLRPAFHSRRKRAEARIRRAVNEAIREAARGGSGA
jgi:HK97 gp10 family phage protein